jgi:hypothetical protein
MWPFRVRALVLALAASVTPFAGCGDDKPVRSGAGCSPARPEVTCSVLFLGNSLTSFNDLPTVFSELAASDGLPVTARARTLGGATLAGHYASADTGVMLDEGTLNVLVMQEQGQIPSSPELLATAMLPAAKGLAEHARRVGAKPLLLQTWARRDGWPEAGITTYAQMQAAIEDGYAQTASAVRADIAPVGEAWARALSKASHLPLWRDDGSHPTPAGTYLAACVLFATIFERDPRGLAYRGGLPRKSAAELQAAAWAVAY